MKLYVALDNIRSSHNVGAILRTALGMDIEGVVTIGITPHLHQGAYDTRLPHVTQKAEKAIQKTALGGEALLGKHFESHQNFIDWAESQKLQMLSLELSEDAVPIQDFVMNTDSVLILGNEVKGVSQTLIKTSSQILEIPISRHKESYNVASSAAIALYALKLNAGQI